MIRIVTDSTCDLPQETIRKYDIRVVPLYINLGDKGYLDGVEITREEFYRNLPTYPAPERVAELRKQAAHLLPDGEILTMDITPVIGAHIGPGAVGFAVVTKQ